jgi:hypothetical protein
MLRVQTLDRYGVPSDDADFAGYLAGASAPTSPYREPFFQELRDGVAAQVRWRNLHVIRQSLSDYLRYAFEVRMADQIEHITAMSRRGNIRIGAEHYRRLASSG